MVLLSTWLCVMAAQTPLREPVVVVVASRRTGAAGVAREVAAAVRTMLARDGAIAVGESAGDDPESCQGQSACLKKLAEALGPHGLVIGADVGRSAKSLAIHLEAVAADASEPVATADFMVAAKNWQDQASAALSVFVHNVVEKLPQPKAPRAPESTVAGAPVPPPSLTPAQAPPEPVVTKAASSSVSGLRIGAWSGLAATAVAAGVGATFLVLGMNDKNAVANALTAEGNGYRSSLLPAELQGLAARGNMEFTVALVSGIGAVVLGVLSGTFFGLSN